MSKPNEYTDNFKSNLICIFSSVRAKLKKTLCPRTLCRRLDVLTFLIKGFEFSLYFRAIQNIQRQFNVICILFQALFWSQQFILDQKKPRTTLSNVWALREMSLPLTLCSIQLEISSHQILFKYVIYQSKGVSDIKTNLDYSYSDKLSFPAGLSQVICISSINRADQRGQIGYS